MTRRRALAVLWGGAAVLATPWAIEWALIRLRRTTNATRARNGTLWVDAAG